MERRVLVVDDEETILAGVTWLLECEQLETAAASDRASAVAMLDGAFFPVVVADLCLHTREEGLAVIDHVLRSSPRSKIIVFTAYATSETEEQLLGRGVSLVLQKPAAGDTLVEAVQALLAEIENEAPPDQPVDLETLYLTVRRRLYDISRRRFHLSHDRAEDVVHEAWLLFLQKRSYVRSVGPWLSGVVANLSRQQLDQVKRRRETPADDLPLETLVEPLRIDDAGRLALEQALGRIDESARTLCRLIAIEGLSYAEASAETGLPLGSIGPTLLRAKRKLRELLSH
jgi:RNA polymerase sigma factor (sigma-70 family)